MRTNGGRRFPKIQAGESIEVGVPGDRFNHFKVSGTTRQEVPEGQEPEDLPEPPSLQGVARRIVPIGKLTTETRRGLARSFQELALSVAAAIESSSVFADLADDAAGYIERSEKVRSGSPVGRGQPLGNEQRELLQRILSRGDMKTFARLIEEKVDQWAILTETFLFDAYGKMYNVGGRGAIRKMGVRSSFFLRDPGVLKALSERANFLVGAIGEDVFNRLRTVVAQDFYLGGKGPADVARSLRSEFSWLKKTRSETIARTETLAVTSEAQQTAFVASGVKMKRWLTTLDGRERLSHFEAHGQMVKIDERFQVGGAQLLHPGDSFGTGSNLASEIINCRCDVSPVVLGAQQFTAGTVWDGGLAPDEFVREQRAA